MENLRKATQRQLAYIQQLKKNQGMESLELEEELSFQEASKMIEDLMGIRRKNGQGQTVKINEPRLGMTMKECYRIWRSHGCGHQYFNGMDGEDGRDLLLDWEKEPDFLVEV